MDKLIQFIKDLISNRFYGSLLINFESGKIVFLKKEETIKLSKE